MSRCRGQYPGFSRISCTITHGSDMAARDDSVIRGSLITCIIFLVFSLALNFFFWQRGNTQAQTATDAKRQLNNANTSLTALGTQADLMKAMLGVGSLTEAQFDQMSQSVGEDADMAVIEDEFVKAMKLFGPEVDFQSKNLITLGTYLADSLRDRNEQLFQAKEELENVKNTATADVNNARTAQQNAETRAAAAEKERDTIAAQFAEDRARINLEKEQTRDALTKAAKDFNSFRESAQNEKTMLVRKTDLLQGTINTQKLELNRFRSDQFEDTQGEIRYVFRHGNVVTIDLGSADDLRTGVTFGVIAGDETRVQDAKVKATIQVTSIDGPHLAQARVVAIPEVKHPIIEGDKVYSPFWAPGRKVKIALAGAIDIDGDNRPDNAAIKGMIHAAGAEVAAEVAPDGTITGKLDPSIRFLVVGEDPEISQDVDLSQLERDARSLQKIGNIKAQATELGLTIIPAWKLQNYLKIMDDSITTPLGSAARGEDFPPERIPMSNRRLPNTLPELYTRQVEGVQEGNRILPP